MISAGSALRRAIAGAGTLARVLRGIPGLIDPRFYVAHNKLVGLRGRSSAEIRLHFLLRGQWRGYDPSATFSTSLAAKELARAGVPRRGSIWSTYLLRRFASAAPFHPLQIPGTAGLSMPHRRDPPLARLAAGMAPRDARASVHPLLPERTVREADVAELYERITAARVHGAPPPKRTVDVLFLNGDQHCPACTQYRVLNPLSALRAAGIDACAVDVDDLHNLAGTRLRARLVVVFRALWTDELAEVLERLRDDGAKLVFDADDLLFDGPRVLTSLQPGASPCDRLDERPGSEGARAAMRRVGALCDAASFPTDELGAVWRRLPEGTPAVTMPSFLSDEQVAVADAVRRGSLPRDDLVIGYSSGTATHGGDFATVAPALARVMAAVPNLRLRVFGPLALQQFEELNTLRHRIDHDPTVTNRWDRLTARLAGCDINIVPLEIDNGYCRCKSEVKYLESGAVGVPSIATAVPAYRRAISEAATGLLVERQTDWGEALQRIVADAALRRRLGRSANEDVRGRYSERGGFAARYEKWVRALLAGDVPDAPEAAGSLERIFTPPAQPPDRGEAQVVLALGSDARGASGRRTARRLIEDRWPGASILEVTCSTRDDGALGGERPWRPGDSEVDLATALRAASAVVVLGEASPLEQLARACGTATEKLATSPPRLVPAFAPNPED